MGALYQIWQLTVDPSDPVNGYTPYTFATANMAADWGIARRESVQAIPGADEPVDAYGTEVGPLDIRTFSWTFLVITAGGPDAAHDLLLAALMGRQQVRLVYKTDAGNLRFTTGSLQKIEEVRDPEQGFRFTFKVTWRIRPDWRLRFSESVELFASVEPVFRADNSEVFGNKGVTTITLVQQPFTVDARGTAGIDLPTLPDTGPFLTITGPAGGDSGILVANSSVLITAPDGTRQPMQFTLPFKLPTGADVCTLDFATQRFIADGLNIRPTKPAYQRQYFRIEPGILNQCIVDALGANQVVGGHLFLDFYRKFA